jgi:hypothetical protein
MNSGSIPHHLTPDSEIKTALSSARMGEFVLHCDEKKKNEQRTEKSTELNEIHVVVIYLSEKASRHAIQLWADYRLDRPGSTYSRARSPPTCPSSSRANSSW